MMSRWGLSEKSQVSNQEFSKRRTPHSIYVSYLHPWSFNSLGRRSIYRCRGAFNTYSSWWAYYYAIKHRIFADVFFSPFSLFQGDYVTYTALINACAKRSDASKAMQWLQRILATRRLEVPQWKPWKWFVAWCVPGTWNSEQQFFIGWKWWNNNFHDGSRKM